MKLLKNLISCLMQQTAYGSIHREDVIARMAEAGFVYANLAMNMAMIMRNEIIQKVLDRKKYMK